MTMASRIAVMNRGILQQIDTPQVLYDTPGNLFVAGFIGSPSMNFFNAKIAKDDGKLYVEGNELHLQIPEDRVNVYMPYAGKEVIFGIRPEDIHNPAMCKWCLTWRICISSIRTQKSPSVKKDSTAFKQPSPPVDKLGGETILVNGKRSKHAL
jgi:ABC-type sugar transport system ATPase subunit